MSVRGLAGPAQLCTSANRRLKETVPLLLERIRSLRLHKAGAKTPTTSARLNHGDQIRQNMSGSQRASSSAVRNEPLLTDLI
jgi:hypothetical protein